jgi:ribosomal protein S18 acetylase RimI-like enzyme
MTKPLITLRWMAPGDESQVSTLVQDTFNQCNASLYAQTGILEFLRYIDPIEFSKRAQNNHLTLLAEVDGKLVGVLEIRNFNHISLLFVAPEFHRRGVARQLLTEVVKIAREQEVDLTEISVNSSPNAVAAYEKLGFRAIGLEKEQSGIRFTPMSLQLSRRDAG